jgi:hypothetical protein
VVAELLREKKTSRSGKTSEQNKLGESVGGFLELSQSLGEPTAILSRLLGLPYLVTAWPLWLAETKGKGILFLFSFATKK